jgi:hypothetical protein
MAVSTLAVYDVNNFLKADSTLQSIAGKTMSFFPIIGSGSETAPFVVYFISHQIPNVESWWNRFDIVSYTVYDTNIDRLLRIGERVIELLSKGDAISDSGGKEGTDVHLFSTYFEGSSVGEAIERDGWFTMNLDFRIYYAAK